MTKQYFVRKRYDTLHYSTVSERYDTLHVLYCTNPAIFRYQHPPSFTDFRHSNVSVHLQDHMHLASTFLGKHWTHRIEGTFRPLHVIIHGRLFMCMRSHSGKIQWKIGCSSFMYLERG